MLKYSLFFLVFFFVLNVSKEEVSFGVTEFRAFYTDVLAFAPGTFNEPVWKVITIVFTDNHRYNTLLEDFGSQSYRVQYWTTSKFSIYTVFGEKCGFLDYVVSSTSGISKDLGGFRASFPKNID